jgi:HK97 family phage portal protein
LNIFSALKTTARRIFRVQTRSYEGSGYNFTRWFSPRIINLTNPANKLASNETIFSAVSKLSNSMATLPLKLYKEFNPVMNGSSDILMNSPNPNMTSFDFFRTLEVHRNTEGNGYALKLYDEFEQVESLWILDPLKVSPMIEASSRELWYEIDGDKGKSLVHNHDMIHVKHIHTTGYKGLSPIDVLKNTLEFDKEVRTFSLDQMDGAKYSFILKYASNLSPEKKKEIIDNFRQFYAENGGVLIQEAGVDIDKLESKFIDTKVFEAEKVTRSRVANVYNMPVHMLGETEGQSFSSMEQMSLEFAQNTMLPIVRQYEQELNRKLLTREERLHGLYFKFNVNALLRADTTTRGEFYFKGIRSGWFKPNEVRAFEELPPVDGGDQLFVSGDLYPIEQAGKEVRAGNEKQPTAS